MELWLLKVQVAPNASLILVILFFSVVFWED